MTKVWKPVEDGIYQGFEVNAEGSEIVTTTNDVHGIEWDASIMLPTNIRLCELVEVDAPPTLALCRRKEQTKASYPSGGQIITTQ